MEILFFPKTQETLSSKKTETMGSSEIISTENHGIMVPTLLSVTNFYNVFLTSPLKTGAFKNREFSNELLILNGRNIHEKIKVYRSADRLCHQAGRDRYTRGGSVPQNGVSEATFYNWKKTYGGSAVAALPRLRPLEEEDAQSKTLGA